MRLKLSPSNADNDDVISIRTVFAAFFGALAWYIFTSERQTVSDCYSVAHYLPSAGAALIIIETLVVVSRRPWRERPGPPVARDAIATAVLGALGLSIAIFFAAAVSCSGG